MWQYIYQRAQVCPILEMRFGLKLFGICRDQLLDPVFFFFYFLYKLQYLLFVSVINFDDGINISFPRSVNPNKNIQMNFESCIIVECYRNKAGYTATEVACGWAGAIFEVTRPFGQEQ